MGCSPFGKLITVAFGGRGKRSRRRKGGRGGHSPSPQPPQEQVTSNSMARTVIYRDDRPIIVMEPVHTVHPPGQAQAVQSKRQVQNLHGPPLPEAAEILPSNHATAAVEQEGVSAAGGGGTMYRYATSPVAYAPGGEYGGRRREYFGGEYLYCYPTPMRDGIYSIAMDANRLTSMFSDENPNACSIA